MKMAMNASSTQPQALGATVSRRSWCVGLAAGLGASWSAFTPGVALADNTAVLAWGGREGWDEMQSMVAEKVDAAIEATGTLMMGGSPETVIARYREHVAANTKRLSAA